MKKQASKFAALLMCGAMVLSLTACGDGGKKTEPTPDAAAKQSYTAGTYTGTATGMKGDVTVEVTVSEDAITDVVVKEHQETYGIGYGLETSGNCGSISYSSSTDRISTPGSSIWPNSWTISSSIGSP